MSLGNILRSAREERGLSPTDVAEQTKMMVQIVEELENEDFHRIAAPIYGRGFLKLYAELLEIDVQPLIEEFMDIYTGKIVPGLRKRDVDKPEVLAKPLPVSEPEEEVGASVGNIPQRVEITPNQGVKNLNAVPEISSEEEITEETQTNESDIVEPSVVEAELPVVAVVENDPSPVPEPSAEALIEEPPAPEVGEGLFDSEEPNLFNTTPLQERIAAARRKMDENNIAETNQDKESKLHLGSNQKLPIFQIGGRMDETYDTEPRPDHSKPTVKAGLDSILGAVNRFVDQLCDRLPFDVSKRSFYIYGFLGLIVIIFMVAGISVLFKLTAPVEKPDGEETAVVERVVEKRAIRNIPAVKGEVPPPPDMYFD